MVAVVMMTVELVLIVMVALKGKDHLRSANHQIILHVRPKEPLIQPLQNAYFL